MILGTLFLSPAQTPHLLLRPCCPTHAGPCNESIPTTFWCRDTHLYESVEEAVKTPADTDNINEATTDASEPLLTPGDDPQNPTTNDDADVALAQAHDTLDEHDQVLTTALASVMTSPA